MRRFLHWLLVLSSLVYGAGLAPMAHDEVMERLTLGAAYPGSEHALAHDGHPGCNHSCHAAGHSAGMASTARPLKPESIFQEPPGYVAREIAREPLPPPTHPPMSA